MNILVTGSAGFIGSAFVRLLLGYPLRKNAGQPRLTEGNLISLDLLTYAGCLDNLAPVQGESRHKFFKGDILDRRLVSGLVREHRIDALVHFAAESHVDRSIEGSEAFAQTNVMGTLSLLEVARENRLRYVQVSTDEVYGSLGETGLFTEETPMAPNSPYSASKAAADAFVRAYVHTHGLDAVITRCSNNYGPYQFPEKFIPLAITRLIDGNKIPVYGTGRNARDWLHVEDHAEGIWLALTKGRKGEVYNFGGYGELRNIEVAHKLLAAFHKTPEQGLEFVTDRKGHDWRYAMDPAKAARELNWKPRWDLDEGLNSMIEWYRANESWWRPKLSVG